MNIFTYTKELPPSREDLKDIGDLLLKSLAKSLGTDLKAFKRHIVDLKSINIHFHATNKLNELLKIELEGVLLYRVCDESPKIDAELLLFSSDDGRIGLRSDAAKSYLSLKNTADGWINNGWLTDSDMDWDRITKPRYESYSKLVDTFDAG